MNGRRSESLARRNPGFGAVARLDSGGYGRAGGLPGELGEWMKPAFC
jgi:hypothetical protein